MENGKELSFSSTDNPHSFLMLHKSFHCLFRDSAGLEHNPLSWVKLT